jgi:ribulose-phosphate 3-epimerase
MDPAALTRIAQTRQLLDAAGRPVPIFADGGIRQDTVAPLAAAGATGVVPGSLLWNSGDLAQTAVWIRGQRPERSQR